MLEVAVIDHGSGSLRSVARALESVGARPRITDQPAVIQDADAVIIPGVGSGHAAMGALREKGLVRPLINSATSGKPFLAVCLGLQLLMDHTDEGDSHCLGIVAGRVHQLPGVIKVPHMGWNQVEFRGFHPLSQDLPQSSNFYFVHSFYAEPDDEEGIVGTTNYGIYFCSVFALGNIWATQFHPEKSGTLGLKVYYNFVRHAMDWVSQGHQISLRK